MKKPLSLKKALELMGRQNARLVCMHTESSPEGFAHYIVPGGYVEPDTANSIKKRPDVIAGQDGLFPGHDQTWRIITGEQS